MAVYPHGDGEQPHCSRFPDGAARPTTRARLRGPHPAWPTCARPPHGDLTDANTHPFCLGEYAFCHNGTLGAHERLMGLADGAGPRGRHRLRAPVPPAAARGRPRPGQGRRRPAPRGHRRRVAARPLSALNFLFSDGEHLYAYRLGVYELHWLAREDQVLVASERITDERWHDVRQDVLLVLSPGDDEPHAERLLGDEAVAGIEFLEPAAAGARVSRPILLLVNPAASGGRSREVATAARAELQLMGVEHRVVESRGLDHAREEAERRGAPRASSWPRAAATASSARSPAPCATPTARWR